jgi:hypothetical protein
LSAFPLRRSSWAAPFLVPLAGRRLEARVEEGEVRIRMGALGRATVPVGLVERIGQMTWPWWGGVGVRIGRGLVAFVAASGEATLLELSEEVSVRAPLNWRTRRLVVGVEDPDEFAAAVAAERRAAEDAAREAAARDAVPD